MREPGVPLPERPTIDFVVVAYRSAADLEACLDSITADAPPGSRAIVVDNASPDSSAEVAARHPIHPLIVKSHANVGFGGGCNLGAASSTADVVFFLNPDARIRPGACAILSRKLAGDPSLGAVAPRVVDPTGQSRATSGGAEPAFRSSLGHYLAPAHEAPAAGRSGRQPARLDAPTGPAAAA